MCGVTTGGRSECDWDCNIEETSSDVFIGNPECFDDCFPQENCITLFLQDYKDAGGICSENTLLNPDAFPISTTVMCELGDYDYNYYQYDNGDEYNFEDFIPNVCLDIGLNRTKGICSEETEVELMKDSCYFDAISKPYLFGTFSSMIYNSCSQSVTDVWCGRGLSSNRYRGKKKEADEKINPIAFVGQLNQTGELIKTDLQFENTKHRYPWICSLRSRSYEKTHYCAVTLLRRPPGPTVMVTTAHCTFLCKSGDNVVDNCCCDNVR